MMGPASRRGRTAPANEGQKRLDHILERIPSAREQLLAAIEDLAPTLTVDAIKEAAQSATRASGTRSR